MKTLYAPAATFLLVLAGPLEAQQVYEKTDAEGNPSFSDMPSEGAEVIEVEPANIAESVDVPEAPSAPPNAPTLGSGGQPVEIVEEGRLIHTDEDLDPNRRLLADDELREAREKTLRPVDETDNSQREARENMLRPVEGNVTPAEGRSEHAETEAQKKVESGEARHHVIKHKR